MTTTRRVFISHAHQDAPLVEESIVRPLRAAGLGVWFSHEDIRGADLWRCQLAEGLEACDWFLVALSPASVDSPWVKREVEWAVEHRWKKIVPALIGDCDPGRLHARLEEVQYIDLRTSSDSAAEEMLEVFGASGPLRLRRAIEEADRDAVRAWARMETGLRVLRRIVGRGEWCLDGVAFRGDFDLASRSIGTAGGWSMIVNFGPTTWAAGDSIFKQEVGRLVHSIDGLQGPEGSRRGRRGWRGLLFFGRRDEVGDRERDLVGGWLDKNHPVVEVASYDRILDAARKTE